MSILIIPLDKESQIIYRASDDTYKDHNITIQDINLLNYDNLIIKKNDELLNIAINQIADLKEQIKKEKNEKATEIEELKKVYNELTGELLNKENEIETAKQNQKEYYDIEKISNLTLESTVIEENRYQIYIKISRLYEKEKELILRLTFEFNQYTPNKLLNSLNLPPPADI